MFKISLALGAGPGVILTLATATAAQPFPPNFPVAISCYAEHSKSWGVAYLHNVDANGDAIYMSPTGQLSGTVNAKGIVEMPTNRPPNNDCFGKTVDELRAIGRVMEFQPAR
jgi:hypothetical protein